MAEDLRRFVADEPIRARRTGGLGRLRLWSRRNPALAALTACLLFVLVTVAVASTATAVYLNATLAQSETHRRAAEEARKAAEGAELQGKYKLWEADLDHAQARRMSRQSGQRFAALRSVREALALPTPPGRSTDELRTEAIAALCLPDVEVEKEWDGVPSGIDIVAFDPDFERYARVEKDDSVSVRRVSDDGELFALPAPPDASSVALRGLEFSPDGRFLHHVSSGKQAAGFRARLWRLDGPRPALVLDDDHYAVAFRPDGARFAATYPDMTIRTFDAASGAELRRYPVAMPRTDFGLAWDPTQPRLLLSSSRARRFLDLDTGRVADFGPVIEGGDNDVEWQPDGRFVAISGLDTRIYLWDVARGRLVRPALTAHNATGGVRAHFSPSGDRMLSTDWTSVLETVGRPHRPAAPRPAPSTGTGRTCNSAGNEAAPRRQEVFPPKVRLFRFPAAGTEFRTFWGASKVRTAADYNRYLPRDPTGRWLAFPAPEGVALLDLAREEQAGLLAAPGNIPVGFEPGGGLLTEGVSGLLRWPAGVDAATGRLKFGPPQRLYPTSHAAVCQASADGRTVALADGPAGVLLLHLDGGQAVLLPQVDVQGKVRLQPRRPLGGHRRSRVSRRQCGENLGGQIGSNRTAGRGAARARASSFISAPTAAGC